MTPFRAATLFGLAVATSAASLPAAQAEGNRLLPFWSQPYPYGYTWAHAEPLPRRAQACPTGSRPIHRGSRERLCDVVLHARD